VEAAPPVGRVTLRPTHLHARATDYERPGGPWDAPPLASLLDEAALRAPDRVLLVDDDERVDGRTLTERCARVAGALAARGVGRGDVVAWRAPNVAAAVVLMRACWRLGAVAAPLHPAWGEDEVARARRALGPHLLVDLDRDADALLGADPLGAPPHVDPHDLAVVLFTSGSSGEPKGVLHSHATLACKARAMAAWHGLGPDDVVLMPAPIAHVSGLLNGVTLPGCVPFTAVLMRRWDATRAVELVAREGVTFMVGPPTFFVAMMRAPTFTRERVATMRVVSSGGAGVTAAFVEEARAAFGCTVKRTYGSTEAPTVASGGAGDDPATTARTDGRAVGAAELRVVDPVTLAARAPGQPGELCVRGPEVCCGYLDAAATEAAFTDDGWFRTGDLALVDASGRLTITGRLGDVIIRGGENIAAAEVESHLEAHPKVRHAVVVGYPDALMGERVCAFVVADDEVDVAVCREWFAARGVARFKTPEQVVRVAELPVLPTGKPDRAGLAAEAGRRFGVTQAGC
jgi:cyclohexanecarboxylate-CoA ligase